MDTKFSKQQQKVINDLNNGYVLITDSAMKGAIVGCSKEQYHIGNRIFWNLVDKCAIYQQIEYPFNYVLANKFKK